MKSESLPLTLDGARLTDIMKLSHWHLTPVCHCQSLAAFRTHDIPWAGYSWMRPITSIPSPSDEQNFTLCLLQYNSFRSKKSFRKKTFFLLLCPFFHNPPQISSQLLLTTFDNFTSLPASGDTVLTQGCQK